MLGLPRALSRAIVALSMVSIGALAVGGCGGRTKSKPAPPVDAGADAEPDAGPPLITESNKLDVLFVLDNSRTANIAHATLVDTLPYFIDRLLAPRCVNGLGQIVDDAGPASPCEVGQREFAALRDIHIGVVSTSLGGHGADTCSSTSPNFTPEQDDSAHLLSRSPGGQVPSYRGLGFLVWDPDRDDAPPGDSDRDEYQAKLSEIMLGVGAEGCGFEAPLEAFYRFLIDPAPYQEIVRQGDDAVLIGVDETLLEQRAAFLRPDSAVLVIVVSDEDDCSIRDGGQYFFAAESGNGAYHLPRARGECAADPDDACCASCGQPTPSGCPPDPVCDTGPYSDAEDPINLRCFDQKRRFGIDFLQPLSRYRDGVSALQITDASGEVHDNPLFVGNRAPEMVVLGVIGGVPWQDIALHANDIASGFAPVHQLSWARILGDGDTPPEDPLMIASREARTGTNPVTGDDLAPPESPSPQANPINGHEHSIPTELQFACTYALNTPLDCTDGSCECADAMASHHNPVCQADDGTYGFTQRYGRATPATRQLALVRDLERQSALASICTAPVFNTGAPDFGYKPAIDAILNVIRRSLVQPESPGQ